MTNPTTNFGWQMPTATDLVTDLPADFEVFGQAVDTDFVDLLGGANGYILSKASATDLDFAWIPNDQGDITGITVTAPITGGGTSGSVGIAISAASTAASGAVQLSDSTSTTSSVLAATPTAVKAAYDLANGAIAKTTVTTAGDIIYRNATVPVRLGIGTAGQVLQVNSGATAPEWAAASSGALTKIVSASFTASAGLSVNSCFTSTYKRYKVVFRIKASTTSGTIAWRWRKSGTDLTSASYYYGWNLTNNNATTTLVGANAATSIDLGNVTATAYFDNFDYEVFYPQANDQVASFFGGGTFTFAGQRGFGGGLSTVVDAYDGFSLITTQNITGEYTVYGYAN